MRSVVSRIVHAFTAWVYTFVILAPSLSLATQVQTQVEEERPVLRLKLPPSSDPASYTLKITKNAPEDPSITVTVQEGRPGSRLFYSLHEVVGAATPSHLFKEVILKQGLGQKSLGFTGLLPGIGRLFYSVGEGLFLRGIEGGRSLDQLQFETDLPVTLHHLTAQKLTIKTPFLKLEETVSIPEVKVLKPAPRQKTGFSIAEKATLKVHTLFLQEGDLENKGTIEPAPKGTLEVKKGDFYNKGTFTGATGGKITLGGDFLNSGLFEGALDPSIQKYICMNLVAARFINTGRLLSPSSTLKLEEGTNLGELRLMQVHLTAPGGVFTNESTMGVGLFNGPGTVVNHGRAEDLFGILVSVFRSETVKESGQRASLQGQKLDVTSPAYNKVALFLIGEGSEATFDLLDIKGVQSFQNKGTLHVNQKIFFKGGSQGQNFGVIETPALSIAEESSFKNEPFGKFKNTFVFFWSNGLFWNKPNAKVSSQNFGPLPFLFSNKIRNEGKWSHKGDFHVVDKCQNTGFLKLKDGTLGKGTTAGFTLENAGNLSLVRYACGQEVDAAPPPLKKEFPIALKNSGVLKLEEGLRGKLRLENTGTVSISPGRYEFATLANHHHLGVEPGTWQVGLGKTGLLLTSEEGGSFVPQEAGTAPLWQNTGMVFVKGGLTYHLLEAPGVFEVQETLILPRPLEQGVQSLKDLTSLKQAGTISLFLKGDLVVPLGDSIDLTAIKSLHLEVLGSVKILGKLNVQELFLTSHGSCDVGQDNGHFGSVFAHRGALVLKTLKGQALNVKYGHLYSQGDMTLEAHGGALTAGDYKMAPPNQERWLGVTAGPCNNFGGIHVASTQIYDVNGSGLFTHQKLSLSAQDLFLHGSQTHSGQDTVLTATKKIDITRSLLSGLQDAFLTAPEVFIKTKGQQSLHIASWECANGCDHRPVYNLAGYPFLSDLSTLEFLRDISFTSSSVLISSSALYAGGDIKGRTAQNFKIESLVDRRDPFSHGCKHSGRVKSYHFPYSHYKELTSILQSGQKIELKGGALEASLNLTTQTFKFNVKAAHFYTKKGGHTNTPQLSVEVDLKTYRDQRSGLGFYPSLLEGPNAPGMGWASLPKSLPILGDRRPGAFPNPFGLFPLELLVQGALGHFAGQVHQAGLSGRPLFQRILEESKTLALTQGEEAEKPLSLTITQAPHPLLYLQENSIYLHIPGEGVTPYQSSGDIKAHTIQGRTEEDLTQTSTRLVAKGEINLEGGGSHVRQTGVHKWSLGESTFETPLAQQQVISEEGSISETFSKDILSSGTHMVALKGDIKREAGGRLANEALKTENRVVTTHYKSGFWGNKVIRTETITQQLLADQTLAGGEILQKAGQEHLLKGAIYHGKAGILFEGGHLKTEPAVAMTTSTTTKDSSSAFHSHSSFTSETRVAQIQKTETMTQETLGLKTLTANILGTDIKAKTLKEETRHASFGATVVTETQTRSVDRSGVLGSAWMEKEAGREVLIPTLMEVENFVSLVSSESQATNVLKLTATHLKAKSVEIYKTLEERAQEIRQWTRVRGGQVGFSASALESGDPFFASLKSIGTSSQAADQFASLLGFANESLRLGLDLHGIATAKTPQEALTKAASRYAGLNFSTQTYEMATTQVTQVPPALESGKVVIKNKATHLVGAHDVSTSFFLQSETLTSSPITTTTTSHMSSSGGSLGVNLLSQGISLSANSASGSSTTEQVSNTTITAPLVFLWLAEMDTPGLTVKAKRVADITVQKDAALSSVLSAHQSESEALSGGVSIGTKGLLPGDFRAAVSNEDKAWIQEKAGVTAPQLYVKVGETLTTTSAFLTQEGSASENRVFLPDGRALYVRPMPIVGNNCGFYALLADAPEASGQDPRSYGVSLLLKALEAGDNQSQVLAEMIGEEVAETILSEAGLRQKLPGFQETFLGSSEDSRQALLAWVKSPAVAKAYLQAYYAGTDRMLSHSIHEDRRGTLDALARVLGKNLRVYQKEKGETLPVHGFTFDPGAPTVELYFEGTTELGHYDLLEGAPYKVSATHHVEKTLEERDDSSGFVMNLPVGTFMAFLQNLEQVNALLASNAQESEPQEEEETKKKEASPPEESKAQTPKPVNAKPTKTRAFEQEKKFLEKRLPRLIAGIEAALEEVVSHYKVVATGLDRFKVLRQRLIQETIEVYQILRETGESVQSAWNKMVMSVGTYFKVEVGETLKEVPKLQQVALPMLAAPLLVSKELAILFLGSTVATYIGCHQLQENSKDQKKQSYMDLPEGYIPFEEGFDSHQRKGEVESYPSDPEGQNIKGENFPAHDQKDRFKDQGFQADPEANKVKLLFKDNAPKKVHIGNHAPIKAPGFLPAFPKAQPVKQKTYVQGGGGTRRRWEDKRYIYEWDSRHGTVEKYNKQGHHLGEFDSITGSQLKPADPTRKIKR